MSDENARDPKVLGSRSVTVRERTEAFRALSSDDESLRCEAGRTLRDAFYMLERERNEAIRARDEARSDARSYHALLARAVRDRDAARAEARGLEAGVLDEYRHDVERAELRADAAERELHRISCGVPIETDGLCPYGIGEALARAEVVRLRAVVEAARGVKLADVLPYAKMSKRLSMALARLTDALDALDEAEAGRE